ncbi:MAG: transposase, partial [bacterium]|nr:transposase [bacterium]
MLGHKSPQGELFRPDNMLREHVGFESFHSTLGEMRGRYFRDEDFEEMYGERGRPCVPPSQLCTAIILQAYAGISDQEAIARTAYDLRWKVALGLELDEQLCAKSTLQLFRSRLVLHDKYRTLFDTSVQECRRHGFV